jgi:hypothetical protein
MAGRILPARPQKSPPRNPPQQPTPPAMPKPTPVAPSWQAGDKVRWQGYTGTFLRETVDGQAEVLIGTRTCLVPRGELQTL